jgi:rubrerythrin
MGSRRTRLRSRPEGGLRRRGRLTLPRRTREGERSPEGDAAADSAVVRPHSSGTPGAPDERFDERRWREAGGPEDRALYGCSCGYVWQTTVSASVSCPVCGATQAW